MTGTTQALSDAEAGERAWRAARGMADIQYAPLSPRETAPPHLPEWLAALFRFIDRLIEPLGRWLGKGWGTIETLLLIGAVIGAAWIAWRLIWPMWQGRRRKAAGDDGWAPDRAEAEVLLADADRLAGEGRFGEAAHLLLRRSVQQIAGARPDWLSPASTAREIAALEPMPAAARAAFAAMAREVERAIYALRDLSAEDWQRTRRAYAEFALVDLERERRA
ncbi:hypothetical protein OLX02_10915 [Novosphingobium sp. KCTC 2891]|uniref:hypothetical protein n=1 Tax=Novosphingobium sp. KCTC 2891 TaxID=2989730 RepID=UPI002223E2D4|nr:hypothetical protein [Novosphingobium sp. KCTC 2891]MCW1383335.1 hypothetical protein [Novosphingobium sp. KCTC 2891]